MYDWIIIGGGIHGTFLANFLTTALGYRFDKVAVLDPHEEPCSLWKQTTKNTGMVFLRSPGKHHLGLHPNALDNYANLPSVKPRTMTLGDSRRPTLELFNNHISYLVNQFGLKRMFHQARASAIRETAEGLAIETNVGTFETRRVILALGQSESPLMPAWAYKLRSKGIEVKHVFASDFNLNDYSGRDRVAIVGGGITAAHLATKLGRYEQPVILVCRNVIPTNNLDFDPCWLGPECMEGFSQISDPDERRRVIDKARHKGTAPQDAQEKLATAIETGRVVQTLGSVQRVSSYSGKATIHLSNGKKVECDRVILATGFEKSRPGGAWLDYTALNLNLPVHQGGYPLVDPLLRWGHPRIFVTGALAELELGPAARNIIGAKLAAERIWRLHKM